MPQRCSAADADAALDALFFAAAPRELPTYAVSVDPDGITRAAVQAPSPLTAQLPAGDAAHAAAAALEAGNLLDGVIGPDLDMYVTSLRRVGADPDVVAAARLELARRPDMFVAVAPAAG